MRTLRLLLLLFSIALPAGLLAQIEVYPHERSIKNSTENSRIRSTNTPGPDPLSLPFWDDFSFTPEGAHPLDSLWIDNSKVSVSSGQAIQPPSINVATFDGLDATGIPYSPAPGDEQVFGYRDTLVSQPILLASVPIANRDSVYLSFSYQAGGNGEPPDQVDFMRLEFKDTQGDWQEAATLTISEAPDPTKFYDTLIQIVDTLFHDDFQFRFISFGRKSGRFDSWHIDYVYLNEHRHATDVAFPDRALSSPIGPIFGEYYSMPIKHFFNHPVVSAASFYLKNLYNKETVVHYNTSITSKKNYANNTSVEHTADLDVQGDLIGNDSSFPAFALFEIFMKILPNKNDATLFDPSAKGIEFTMQVEVDTADNLPPLPPDNKTDYSPKYLPIDFRWNDTLQVNYFLDSVYAYDDGTAEYAAGLVHAGNELAYRFTNIYSGQDSVLNGVYIYFPSFAGSSNSTLINFFVMNDNGGTPGSILYEQNLSVDRTTNNEFTEYDLLEGVVIEGPFYIGYREPSSGKVRVGLDKSNDTGNRMYYRTNSTSAWNVNDEVTGSLMIRPRFGPHTLVVSGLPEERPLVSIFPNPNRGEFYIQGQATNIQLMTVTGQPVPFVVENLEDKKRVSASITSGGLYIIRYTSGKQLQTQKVLFIH